MNMIKQWKNMSKEERQAEISHVLKKKEKPCVSCGVNTLYFQKDGTIKIHKCLICFEGEQ